MVHFVWPLLKTKNEKHKNVNNNIKVANMYL